MPYSMLSHCGRLPPKNAISPALTDGVYEVAVTATDTYGNVGADATNNELDGASFA